MRRAACLAVLLAGPAGAATLAAGPGTPFPQPSDAIAAASPGDTVVVAPGTYYDCAAWNTDRLTVDGPGAVFSDRTCADKAAFVIGGSDTVLRGLTFTHLRVADGNGAGIRLEGGSLLVEDCTFDDDQAAVVAFGRPEAALVLRRVTVRRVGVPGSAQPAVSVGAIASVRLEDSRFGQPRGGGSALRSLAPATVAATRFDAGPGDSSVIDAAATLTVDGSTFDLTGLRPAAIRAQGPAATVRGTTLRNGGTGPALLLQDWTDGTPVLSANTVAPRDAEVSGAGFLVHRAKDTAHAASGMLRGVAGRVRRLLP